jgi:hypothetical protein
MVALKKKVRGKLRPRRVMPRKPRSSSGDSDGGGVVRAPTGFFHTLPADKRARALAYEGSIFSGNTKFPRVKP